jgi:hypothetical protein
VTIFWIGRSKRKHVTLGEWKYTESNFGVCSAFTSATGKDKARCRSLDVVVNPAPARLCLLTEGGSRRSRRYWEHMEVSGISLSAFVNVQGCPFQGPFYQLMRQFLLAAYLWESGEADEADVVSIGFAGNTKLHQVPPQLRPLLEQGQSDIVDAWNTVLNRVPALRHWAVEDVMDRLNHIEGVDLDWRNYLHERYDV